MADSVLKTTADKLVAHCRADTAEAAVSELYDPQAVSVEAGPPPGEDSAETRGVEGILGKHAWWRGAMEVHSASADGPFLHGSDRFAVIFDVDATEKASGNRVKMHEVGIYTVNPAGKIVREEFFYTM